MSIALFEFDLVEVIYRYFPKRWVDFGSTLLFIPNSETMSMPQIEQSFKERYRIVGNLPAVAQQPGAIKLALMANLQPPYREKAADLFQTMPVFDVLARLVADWHRDGGKAADKAKVPGSGVFQPGTPLPGS